MNKARHLITHYFCDTVHPGEEVDLRKQEGNSHPGVGKYEQSAPSDHSLILGDFVCAVNPASRLVVECILNHTIHDGQGVATYDAVKGTVGMVLAEGTDGDLAFAGTLADVRELVCNLTLVGEGHDLVNGSDLGSLSVGSASRLHHQPSVSVGSTEGIGHCSDCTVIVFLGEALCDLGV